jgi:hypothetical protein
MNGNEADGRNPFGAGGASGTEMRIFGPSSEGRVELLLDDPDSVYPGEAGFETASFVRAVRATVPVSPDPALEAEMVTALAGAARTASLEATRAATGPVEAVPAAPHAAPRWRLRVAALAAVVAALPLLMTGLAFAGLTLPDAVDDAFEAVGIDLPNQGSERKAASPGDRAGDKDEAKASKDAAGTAGTGDAAAAGAGDAGSGKPDGANGKGKPEHAGQEGTPPGQGGTPPGQGGDVPGTGGSTGPPPDAGAPPEAAPPVTPPGQGGVAPPGHGGVPPGQANK